MNILRLNEVVDQKKIYYWTNATGDIFVPGLDRTKGGREDDLPGKAKLIYQFYWDELSSAHKCVVCLNGVYGIMLEWLFDWSWLKDMGLSPLDDKVVAAFHKAVKLTAETFVPPAEAVGIDSVLYGELTDPDGDEIVMFVPFTDEQLNEAAASASWMAPDAEPDTLDAIGKALYDSVETLLYQELRKNRNSVDKAPESSNELSVQTPAGELVVRESGWAPEGIPGFFVELRREGSGVPNLALALVEVKEGRPFVRTYGDALNNSPTVHAAVQNVERYFDGSEMPIDKDEGVIWIPAEAEFGN